MNKGNISKKDLLTVGRIALDHLNEMSNYYTKLQEMEKDVDSIKKSKEKEDFFNDRTKKHMDLVSKQLDKIIALDDPRIDNSILEKEKIEHDQTKLREPERKPYIDITWFHRMKMLDGKYGTPENIKDAMQQATFHHVSTNKHHPEFWDKGVNINSINRADRDAPPKKAVDATKMPLSCVACMVADWLAMSEELGTNAKEWADKNIGIRWKFNDKQKKLIYDLIDGVENMKVKKSIDGGKKESADELKRRLLSNIEHFLEKYEDNQDSEEARKDFLDIKNEIEKMSLYKTSLEENNVTKSNDFSYDESLKKDIHVFLKGYETLAYLGSEFSDERLNDLFQKAAIINENKQFNLSMDNSDRIGRIIAVDSVAHALHQNKNQDGSSQYKILDDLADVSKSFGEQDRSTRLLIVENPDRASEIEKLLKLEILQKGNLERSGKFWKLMEKAIKEGISKLSNFELVALREWLYAKL